MKKRKRSKGKERKKKKKKKPEAMKSRNPTCCSMWVCYSKHFLTCFLPNLGRKHLGLTNFFPFLLLIKHPLKKFSLLFISILPISPSIKRTLVREEETMLVL